MAQTVKITPASGKLEFIGNISLAASTSAIFTGNAAGSISLVFPASQGISITGSLTVAGSAKFSSILDSANASGTLNYVIAANGSGGYTWTDVTSILGNVYVPLTRTITIDGVSQDLSVNRTWNILPTAGLAGQILAKNSGTNYDVTWIDNYTSTVKHLVKLGSPMSIGTPVYVSGATGNAGTNMIVSPSTNTSEMGSSKTIGLLETGGTTNDIVYVITEGLIEGIDTSAAQAGDPVWLGPNGTLLYGLANKPVAPNHQVFIGIVTRVQQNNGEIFVKVQNGFELHELHDVLISGAAAGQLLRRDSDGLWKNWTPNYLTAEADTLATVTARGATTATAISLTNSTQSNSATSGALTVTGGVGIGGNLYVDGNLVIGGTTTTVNAQNLTVSDNMIYLNNGIQTTIIQVQEEGGTLRYITSEPHNYSVGMSVTITGVDPDGFNFSNRLITEVDATSFTIAGTVGVPYIGGGIARAKSNANPDLGFAAGYNDGSYAHTGLFRDASDGVYKFFKGYTPEPDADLFINTAHASFQYASLRADQITGTSFIKVGGTSSQFLKADGSVDSNTYLTSYTEADTLDSVTDRGATTTNNITVGGITTDDVYAPSSSINFWVNSLNSNSRFYMSPVHQDGRINLNAVAGSNNYTLLRAWHSGSNAIGLGTGSSAFGGALSTYGDSILIGTGGSLYFMNSTFGPLNIPYRLGITTNSTTTSFHAGVDNNLTNIETNAFTFTAKSHTFYTGTTTGNQRNPDQYTPLHLSNTGKVGINNINPLYTLDVGGSIQASLYVYAGLFYDNDDTNYYVNPSGLSVLSSARVSNGILDGISSRFIIPSQAYTVGSGPQTAGAIKISLPTACYGNNTMMSMTVQVYEYSTGQSFTLRIGGYNYYNHDWYNVFAYMLNDSGKLIDINVYFGNDGTRDVIWIGEQEFTWEYPNVFVTDFQAGHTQTADWRSGWSITFDQSAPTNITASRTARRQIDTGNISSQSVSYATSSGNSATTSQTNFSSLTINNAAVATQAYVTSQGYLTSYTETDPYRVTSAAVTGTTTKTLTLTRADSSTVTATWTDYDSDSNTFVNAAAFNTSNGVLTLTRNDAGTVTVDLDGRYSLTGHNHDDRYLPYSVNTDTGGLARNAWYTIAVNPGDRASGKFILRDVSSGNHQSVVFYATHHYGSYSDITVLINSRYSGSPFRQIRIVDGSTYDGAMLQVYIDESNSQVQAWLLDNIQSQGWIIKDWVPDGVDPGNLNNFAAMTETPAQVDLDNTPVGGMITTGPIFGGGDTTQYEYLNTNNYAATTDSRYYTETEIGNFFSGATAITGYSKSNWDTAYNNSVTAVAVSGTTTKTLTLTQQDGGTLTASWTDYDSDTNTFVNSASFNTTDGVLTLTRNDSGTVTVDLDGRYQLAGSYLTAEADTLDSVTDRDATTTNAITVGGLTSNGDINLGANQLVYTQTNVSAPSTTDQHAGSRIVLYPLSSGSHYAIGIESGHMWFNTDGGFKWYNDSVLAMHLDTNNLKIVGNLYTTGIATINGNTQFTTGGNAALSVNGNVISFGSSNNDLSYFRRNASGQFQWQSYLNGNNGEIHIQPYGGKVSIGSAVPTAKLTVSGSTAGESLLEVYGTNGLLFAVTDDLSNSLFSANTIAGLPVIEAFADGSVVMGPFSSPVTVTTAGQINTTNHGNSSQWIAGYNDRIVSAAVSGGPTKTLTLTQQDGGTLTASWSDTDTDTNTYLTNASFNTSTGVLTLTRNDAVTVTVDLDDRYALSGAYLTAESDTLATVTGRGNTTTTRIGVSTSTAINLAANGNVGTWIGGIEDSTTGWTINSNGIGLKADNTTYSAMVMAPSNGLLYFGRTNASGVGTLASWLTVNSSLVANFTNRPQHAGNNLALVSELPTVNNATLTMNVSGNGLSGSQTFTSNQSSAATFTVTSNATSANTASTIVFRDGSGNFSAGTITATLSGNASSATSATQVVTLQDTPPTGVNGMLWWETDTGQLKVYYGASSAWVDALPMPDMSLYYPVAGGAITGNVNILQTLTVNGNILASSNLTVTGTISASGYNDSNWNAAYNDRITAVSVSGGPTKTITLTQQDGGTLTASWSDTDTDTNTYLTSASFNTSNGVLTLTRNDSVTVTVDLDGRFYTQSEADGRYVNVTGDVMTGALGISTGTAGIDAFYVDGTYGRLFTVTDDLTDAVFSVNTISGLPIIEAYSDYSVRMGRYNQNDFYISTSGNVGFGKASPTAKVDISGNLRLSSYLQFGSAGGYIEPHGTYSMNLRRVNLITFAPDNTWNDATTHGIISTGIAGDYTDSLSINSYNDITLRLDSNNNNSESYLRITNNTQGQGTIAYIGYDGSTTVAYFGGVATAASDFRAPIFYDSADTNYYLDPNSSSVLYSTNINRAQITNDLTTSSGQGRFGGWYTGTGYTGSAVEAGFSGSSGYVIAYNRSTSAYQPLVFNGSNIYLNPVGGSVYINTSPIIRQSAGTGWLSGNYSSSETSSTTGAIYSIGGSYYPTGSSLNTMYGVGYANAAQGAMPTGAANWGFYVVSNGTTRVWLGADDGNIIATGNIYMGTSNLVATQSWVTSQGYITGVSDVWVNTSGDTMTGNLSFGATSNLGITWGLNTDAAFIKFISSGNQAGGSYLEIGTQDDSDEEIKFTQSGNVRMYVGTDGHIYANNSFKAPIFYDSANTNYYLDPNSQSVLYNVQVSNVLRVGPNYHIQQNANGDLEFKYI